MPAQNAVYIFITLPMFYVFFLSLSVIRCITGSIQHGCCVDASCPCIKCIGKILLLVIISIAIMTLSFFSFIFFVAHILDFESLNLLHVINSYLRAHDVDQILWDSGLYYRHLHSAAFREYRDFLFMLYSVGH